MFIAPHTSNNPVNRIDPTGHYDCSGISEPHAKAGCEASNTNNYQIDLPKDVNCDIDTDSPECVLPNTGSACDDVGEYYSQANCINSLGTPPVKSYSGGDAVDEYEWGRETYWKQRLINIGKCKWGCSESTYLYEYYDLGQKVKTPKFDPTRIDIGSTISDGVGIPLGFFGLGGLISGVGKNILQGAGFLDASYSFAHSRNTHDETGQILAVGSSFPLVGGFISLIAFVRDLGRGSYQDDFIPSISP